MMFRGLTASLKRAGARSKQANKRLDGRVAARAVALCLHHTCLQLHARGWKRGAADAVHTKEALLAPRLRGGIDATTLA